MARRRVRRHQRTAHRLCSRNSGSARSGLPGKISRLGKTFTAWQYDRVFASFCTLALHDQLCAWYAGWRFLNDVGTLLRRRLIGKSSRNESSEEGMRVVRFALKFRMILAADKIRMVAQLD